VNARSTRAPVDGLVVREARRSDLPTILALVAADAIREVEEIVAVGSSWPAAGETDPAGAGTDVAPEYVAAFDAISADPNALLLVGELDGEVVATCQLNFLRHLMYRGGLVAQVESVRTAGHLRGRGIGTTLLRWVIAEARRRGAVRVQLTSNVKRVDARRFYERLGFVASHVGMKLYLGQED
jgi:GNAT superfamily N-acetyltransferase